MSVVDFSVNMKPLAHIGLGDHGLPAIRLQPIKPGDIPGIDPAHSWAWAIVQIRKNMPDALLVGGTAESQSAAVDLARRAFASFELKWADQSGRLTHG